MKLRNFAVTLGVAALTLVGITPAMADSTDNTNSPSYWLPQATALADGAAVSCSKDAYGSIVENGTAVKLDPYTGEGAGYVLLVVKGGAVDNGWGDGNAEPVEHPVAGTAYFTPLNGGGQQAGVSHWIVCVAEKAPTEEPPSQPADKVTYGEWVDGEYVCDDETLAQTRTKTTTPYRWDGEAWVLDTANAVTIVEQGQRDLEQGEFESCPVDNPPPPKPEALVVNGDWIEGQWVCGATSVTLTRTVTTTSYVWNGDAWVLDTANAVVSMEGKLRDPSEAELESCDTEEPPPAPPVVPSIEDAEVTPMCGAEGPYLAYTVTVKDPEGTLADTATLTFHHPTDDTKDWSIEVALGSGTVIWPGLEWNADGTVATWPGWYWDVDGAQWVEDASKNYGWTTDPDTKVSVAVDPLSKTLTVTYPGGEVGCEFTPTITVVSDDVTESPTTPTISVAPTKAAAAVPVQAAATYAG